MRKALLILVLFIVALIQVIQAEPVDSVTAKQLAANFHAQLVGTARHNQREAGRIVKTVTTNLTDHVSQQSRNVNCYYIVNFSDGFVIIAADDRLEPILAYSTESVFETDFIPENTAAWLDNYRQEISFALNHDFNAQSDVQERWAQLKHNTWQIQRTSIGPLIQTTYGQSYLYNQYCPVSSSSSYGHAPTGCVATAMAQIIRYWEYPERGVGSNTYISNYPSYGYGNFGPQTADFGATTYDYSLMPNSLNTTTTNEQNNEVARLMYHCGVSVNMMYGVNTSGAFSAFVPFALENYFAYQKGITYVSKSNYSAINWQNLIRNELNNMRPVLYEGQGSSGGHAFVCDGYEGDYFHFNWGWNGSYNGNFRLNLLNPGSYNYSNSQGAVIGISAADPTIRTIPDKINISSYIGSNSEIASIEIRGIFLTDSISVSASPHFKVGKTRDSLQSQLVMPTKGGTLYIQYTPTADSVTTESGIIILNSGNISDTVHIYATTCLPLCFAPKELTAYPVYHGINLSWTAPETNPDTFTNTLSWDSSFYFINYNSINTSYCMLQRFDTSDLAPYKNSILKAISFAPCESSLSYRLVVYQGGGYINNQYIPGEQIVNQEVPLYQLINDRWNTINLMNPVFVDGTKELWFGIIAHADNLYGAVLRLGNDVYKAHKGGILAYASGPYTESTSFTWTDIASMMGTSRNFPLKGIFESFSNHVTEYEIYRNDSLIGTSTDTRFSDTNMQTDSVEYTVYAQWDNDCSSHTSIKALADTNLTPCNFTIYMHAEHGNGWNGNRIRIHHRGSIQEVGFQYGQDSIANIDVYDDLLELEWVSDTLSDCSFSIMGPCLYYESPDNLTNGIFLSQNINCDAAQISTPDFTYSILPVCDSSNVNFHYYPMAGDNSVTIQYGDGESSTINLSDPSIESMTFHHSYPVSGDYQVSLSVEKENCDIIRTISKTISIDNIYSTPDIDTVYISVCDSCTWNNETLYESGDYLYRFDNAQGCDSLVVLHLVLFSSVQTDDYLTLCENELPYSYGDTVFGAGTVSSSITFNLTTIHGCDSLATLHLTIYPAMYREDSITLCENELPYSYADTTFEAGTISSVFTFQRLTVHGCDSIVSLYLTINPTAHTEMELALCENELPYMYEDTVFEAGTPEFSMYDFQHSTINGCDSIVTLYLTIYPTAHTDDTLTLYDNEFPYPYADTVFEAETADTLYTFNLLTADGCDSIVTLHLTIIPLGINDYTPYSNIQIIIYPNPTQEVVNIKVEDSFMRLSSAEIYDVTGRKVRIVRWAEINSMQRLNMEELTPGLYFIRLFNEDKCLGIQKVIKQQ